MRSYCDYVISLALVMSATGLWISAGISTASVIANGSLGSDPCRSGLDRGQCRIHSWAVDCNCRRVDT